MIKKQSKSYIQFGNYLSAIMLIIFIFIELLYLDIIPNKVFYNAINNIPKSIFNVLLNDKNSLEDNINDNNLDKENDINLTADGSRIIFQNESYSFATVSEAYFNNSLFIGDSRILGFSIYRHLPGATYYCYQSADVFTILTKEYENDEYGMISLYNLLTIKRFDKIYIMLGINNVGAGIDSHREQYKIFLDTVINLQPTAIIYLLGNLHISNDLVVDNEYLNNDRINTINKFISEFEDKRQIFYLDPNVLYDDEFGNMDSDLSYDNSHIYLRHYDRLLYFLLTHAIVYDE